MTVRTCPVRITLAVAALVSALVGGLPAAPQSLAHQEAPALPDVIGRTAAEIDAVWPQTDRIWRGSRYADLVLIVTDRQRGWAIAVDGTRELDRTDLTSVPMPRPSPGLGFQVFPDWQGRGGVTVALAPALLDATSAGAVVVASQIFALASHELFHVYVQSRPDGAWRIDPERASRRGTPYPVQAEPRVMRLELYEALHAAYAEPEHRAQHLGAAAYWYQRWSSESGEAADGYATDLTEGTAEYFSQVATVRAEVGFDAPPEVYRIAMLAQLDRQFGAGWSPRLDQESYRIGVAAGLLAEEQGLAWQAAAEGGVPAIALLLRNVAPMAQQASAGGRSQIEAGVAELNARLARRLDPLIDAFSDPSRPLLALPTTGLVGTFSPGEGFYLSEQVPATVLVPALSARFDATAGQVGLNSAGAGFAAAPSCAPDTPDAPPAPSDPGMLFVLVPLAPDQVEERSPGHLTIRSPALLASVDIKEVQDDAGRTIYCATTPPPA